MKHSIKNYWNGYRCLTHNTPFLTLSGMLEHLGRVPVSLQNIKELEKWSEKHKDILNKLNNLGIDEEIVIDI